MSKSHNDPRSRILLTDSAEDIHQKIKLALTDSEPGISYDPSRRPGVSNLIEILSHVQGGDGSRSFIEMGREHQRLSMRAFKEHVASTITKHLREIRERYLELTNNTSGYIDSVAEDGAKIARDNADITLIYPNCGQHTTFVTAVHRIISSDKDFEHATRCIVIMIHDLENQIGILFHKGSPSGKEKFDTTLPRSCYIPTMSPRTSEMLRMRACGDSRSQPAQFAKAKHLFLRQDVVKCQTELGRGDCVEAGSCRGFFETDRTLCPQGDGPKEPWPCIGPNDVQCCVKNENINNNSSVSTSHSTTSSTTFSLPLATPSIPTTTTIPPTATPTTSTSPQPLSPGSAGLSTGAKGGIAGGIAAGVLIIGLIALRKEGHPL
ncbi:tryptophanyl-tRNA synthetase [Histoplasma capsulatum H143]|uniref:Tryptophanyl-tRNA synthetase n=1 Tax=Ajellomyces capsulatus (strain H143) TaxID=544712 RepID=C6HGP1_AJECH|nr:tryptophanyl-tRNA synthetase [Histoplasma capsulatum H143]